MLSICVDLEESIVDMLGVAWERVYGGREDVTTEV